MSRALVLPLAWTPFAALNVTGVPAAPLLSSTEAPVRILPPTASLLTGMEPAPLPVKLATVKVCPPTLIGSPEFRFCEVAVVGIEVMVPVMSAVVVATGAPMLSGVRDCWVFTVDSGAMVTRFIPSGSV